MLERWTVFNVESWFREMFGERRIRGGGKKLGCVERLMNGSRRVIYSASRILVDRRHGCHARTRQNLKRLFIKSERTPAAGCRQRVNAHERGSGRTACTSTYVRRGDPVNSGTKRRGEEKERKKRRKQRKKEETGEKWKKEREELPT